MFTCLYCSKEYTRKTSYSRHLLLCEIIYQQKNQSKVSQKREQTCYQEDAPPQNISTQSLYNIIQELVFKTKHMEEELDEIKKYISTNVSKINVIEMLNSPTSPIYTPKITYEEWKVDFLVPEQYIRNLENMTETMNTLLKNNLSHSKTPFISFAQKKHVIYVYTSTSTNDNHPRWRKQTPEEFTSLFKFIHSKITQTISAWYRKNKEAILCNDRMSDEYQRNLGKLASIDLKSSAMIGKIRSHLYNSVQTDLKTISYTFE